jgi:hypothetical protein
VHQDVRSDRSAAKISWRGPGYCGLAWKGAPPSGFPDHGWRAPAPRSVKGGNPPPCDCLGRGRGRWTDDRS